MKLIRFARLLTLIPFGLAILMVFDLVLPPAYKDMVEIESCVDQVIKAKGQYSFEEPVPIEFSSLAKKGDTVDLRLSRFFYEWKEANLIRDGKIIASCQGEDVLFMWIFAFVFLSTLFVYLPIKFLPTSGPIMVISYFWVIFLSLFAAIIWVVEILMWLGYSQPPPGG